MKPYGPVKRENTPIVTPVGIAKNPGLTKPDSKFLEAGVYGVSLVVGADAAKPLIEIIEVLPHVQACRDRRDDKFLAAVPRSLDTSTPFDASRLPHSPLMLSPKK